MSAIQLYSNDYITVEYRPDDELICHVVHKPIGDDQVQMLKDALNAGTKALAEYGVCKWLSDDRKNGPLPQEVVDWGNRDWNQRTIDAGWKYWANVVPQEVEAAGTLMPVINYLYEIGLRMQVFTDLKEAQEWLKSVG